MKRLLLLLFVTAAYAQEPIILNDHPHPHGETLNRIALATSIAFRAGDVTQTCYHLTADPGWHETGMPTQHCGGIAAMAAGMVFVGVVGQKTMHHLGWHRFESTPHWAVAAGAAYGIIYSMRHSR